MRATSGFPPGRDYVACLSHARKSVSDLSATGVPMTCYLLFSPQAYHAERAGAMGAAGGRAQDGQSTPTQARAGVCQRMGRAPPHRQGGGFITTGIYLPAHTVSRAEEDALNMQGVGSAKDSREGLPQAPAFVVSAASCRRQARITLKP